MFFPFLSFPFLSSSLSFLLFHLFFSWLVGQTCKGDNGMSVRLGWRVEWSEGNGNLCAKADVGSANV